jgi:hypothetical protein
MQEFGAKIFFLSVLVVKNGLFANYSTKNSANVEKMTHLFARSKKKYYLCARKG